MLKSLLPVLLFLLVFSVQAQDNEIKVLKGQVVDAETQKPLSAAHVINLNSVEGTITNDVGNFEIPAKVSDTISVSYLGYSSIKIKVTNDLLKGNELLISLYEKSEQVREVVIKSTKLIGVLEVDVKQVPKDRYTRIKINGIKQTYEIGRPKGPSPVAALFQPVELLYKLFGKKPKQLKKLQKIKKEDELRKIMAGKFDREVMMEYLEMDRVDLMKLLSDCNYSEYFIKKASDLQMIEAVLDCYENYKAVKKGKIDRSRLPEKRN